ncbi:MAG: VanZ family protein [Deltaproteobacteria bacterium]
MKILFSAKTWFFLCALFIFYATTIPWDIAHAPTLEGISWIPGWDAKRDRIWSIPDMVQNVVLFGPFGFFGFVGLGFIRRRGAIVGALAMGFLGLALSLSVEALQTMSATRSPSTTDLLTNFLGALGGGIAAAIYVVHLEARLVRALRETARERPGLLILLAYFAAITLGSLAPFIPTLDLSTVWENVKAFRADPWGAKPFGALITDGLLFGALAYLTAKELPPYLSSKRWMFKTQPIAPASAAIFAFVLVSTLALALEAAQMIIIGHSPGLQDAVVGMLLAGVGAGLAAGLPGGIRPATELGELTRRTPWLVLAFAILAPTTRAMSPFIFQTVGQGLEEITVWQWVPFWALFQNINVSTFRNVFEAAAFYLPLGYAVHALGRRPRVGFVVCLVLGETLELLQIPVVGRVFDITEGLYAGLMGLVGAWILTSLSTPDAPTRPAMNIDDAKTIPLQAPPIAR